MKGFRQLCFSFAGMVNWNQSCWKLKKSPVWRANSSVWLVFYFSKICRTLSTRCNGHRTNSPDRDQLDFAILPLLDPWRRLVDQCTIDRAMVQWRHGVLRASMYNKPNIFRTYYFDFGHFRLTLGASPVSEAFTFRWWYLNLHSHKRYNTVYFYETACVDFRHTLFSWIYKIGLNRFMFAVVTGKRLGDGYLFQNTVLTLSNNEPLPTNCRMIY